MQNKSRKNLSETQITGFETVTSANGNGNGNGKKTDAKPTDNVKVIPRDKFDRENSIKITPFIDCLTEKGIEMYTNMGDLENAKLFIDDLAMTVQNDTELTGLMMILDAINRKISGEDKDMVAGDYINWLMDYIFHW